MAINFPIPTSIGQLYTYNQTVWEWSGEYWGLYSAQTGYVTSAVTVGSGYSDISGLTNNTLYLKGFSGTNINIVDNGDTLTFSSFDNSISAFTYSSNTFNIIDGSGFTYSATIDTMTGLTVNGTLSATTISADTIGNVQYIDFDTTQTGTTAAEGRLFWDVNNRTLSLGMIGGPVQQIGEEQYYLVENQTTGILNDGTVVRAAGTSGASGKILIDYMIANATIPAFTTLGVLTQPLNSGDTGYVTSFGLVRGLDTTGSLYGETWFDGTVLYVSPTILGGFTSVKPINPNLDIIIAIVMKAGSGTTGSIFVRPDVYRPFKDPNRIIVAKQNGDFTTIKDALDTITASSSSNRYVIDVGPGEFYESTLDLNNKPYVSIVGSNIQTTLIIPTGSTQHILNIGINNEISFLSFSGAGSGYAAIHCDNIGDFAQAHKCSFYDCDINIWVKSFSSDTKFYGEYLDFNGEYSYGVRCEATNGFLAFANLENCYNFPVGTGVTIANYATGSGATINTYVIDNISNGVSGSTAYWLQNDAMIHASAINSEGWTYGIYVPNTGGPPMFQFNGATFTDNQYDAYVDRTGTMGYYQGIADHTKIFTVSEDFYWVFLDSDDGELDVTRKISVTFTDGSHTDASTLIFEGSTMGLMSGGTISSVSATTINTQAGYGYLEVSSDIGIVRRIDWVDTTITLSANTENYIFINENGILSASGSIPNTFFNILMGRVVTNSTGIEFIEQSPQNANHTSNRFSTFNRTALGPVYATGSIVTEGTTPFTLDVSAGDYFFSENQFLPSGGTPITFTQYYRDGLGGWITSATTGVTNAYYDGNGSLSGLTGYTKHTLYIVGDGVDEKYFLVLGQNQYDTLVQTEGALLPTPPTYFDDAVTQIANIYVQSGTTGITQIEDIRPVIGFKAGGVNASSLHANLLGLSSDDHLQYLLVNGGRAMSGNLNMGGNNIVSAGTINGVTIESHAIRHQFGGSDQVGTTTPSANAIPYADVNGKLDSWISTASTTNLGLVKLSTSPVTPSIPIVVGENDTRFQNSFTGASFNDSTDTLTLNRINGTSLSVTGITDYYVTGFSYDNANTITLSQNNGQSTGITLNVFTGITATTISATTYQNLPTDFNTFITAFTYNNNTFTINDNSGNTFNATFNSVTGLTVNGTLSATTISGGTFYGDGSNLSNVVNSLTTSTGLSANTTTGNITILNTAPDQIVTLSGGTGITTGGTYPNFSITNSSPDQIVTISGGTGILTGGTYPNFEIANTAPDQIVSISGGTGILTGGTYPNFQITNTAPDQIVTLSGGTGITTGGTYPNFSITNSSPDQLVTISGGTGILTGGTYPNFEITNTAPDQLVTISGGTGITTGGTYPNFTLVNSSPDQLVTISGGTGILTGGTYPNFEITNTAPDLTVTISGGTGILTGGTYPNFTLVNSSPDQIVTISGGTGILTGGTYPNFEITNTAPDLTVTISGGSGMSVTGTYPNFTIANTGETFVTGVTYSANTLTVSQNGGQSPINTTIGLRIKSGAVTAVSFIGIPRKATVTFTTAYPDTNYTIGITGTDNRIFTYESKTASGFVINSNANAALTGDVHWQTIAYGES